MPSLKSKLPELFLEAYELSIDDAVRETGINEAVFPKQCEWTLKQNLDQDFLPQ